MGRRWDRARNALGTRLSASPKLQPSSCHDRHLLRSRPAAEGSGARPCTPPLPKPNPQTPHHPPGPNACREAARLRPRSVCSAPCTHVQTGNEQEGLAGLRHRAGKGRGGGCSIVMDSGREHRSPPTRHTHSPLDAQPRHWRLSHRQCSSAAAAPHRQPRHSFRSSKLLLPFTPWPPSPDPPTLQDVVRPLRLVHCNVASCQQDGILLQRCWAGWGASASLHGQAGRGIRCLPQLSAPFAPHLRRALRHQTLAQKQSTVVKKLVQVIVHTGSQMGFQWAAGLAITCVPCQARTGRMHPGLHQALRAMDGPEASRMQCCLEIRTRSTTMPWHDRQSSAPSRELDHLGKACAGF